jgi:hypothetical protein
VASAEAPTGTPARSVSVEGVASVPIAQGADAASANAAYRQGMAAAVSDGQGKAEFLVAKVGASLGAPQSIGEGGGGISCAGESESGFVEYQGAQPDFGAVAIAGGPAPASGVAAPRSGPAVGRPNVKKRRKKRKRAVKATTATSCTLSAQVALVYAIG